MASYYTSPEASNAQKRRWGQKLTTAGVMLAGAGILGIILAVVLKLTWILGFLGGAVGTLSWFALFVGGGLFVYGFLQIKEARDGRSL